MGKPENDTSASEGGTDGSASDPEALFDALVEADVLEEGEDGVRTTDDFDHSHGIYYDSYVGIGDAEFHRSVASTFGLPDDDTAAELIEAEGVTREDLAQYLAIRSLVPDDVPATDLAVMAGLVGEVVPDTPVPTAVTDVTDDPASFVADHDRAVVTVWKRFCAPCDALKPNLPDLLAAVPDDVPVAGLDGEAAGEFCRTYEVESAPAFVLFRGGESRRIVTGNDPEETVAAIRSVYS